LLGGVVQPGSSIQMSEIALAHDQGPFGHIEQLCDSGRHERQKPIAMPGKVQGDQVVAFGSMMSMSVHAVQD
jgi:hypothetical protein